MGITPDRTPGPSLEEELQLEDRTTDGDPTVAGAIRYLNGDFRAMTSGGIKSFTTGSGLSEGQHEALDTLVHEIAEDAYLEVTRTAGKVSSITYWTNSEKTKKIRDVVITRDGGGKVSQTVEKQYDGDGNTITGQTLTSTITRSGGKVDSMTMVES